MQVTREELSSLREAGLTRQQIADKLGTSLSTVKRLLTRHGLVIKRVSRAPCGLKVMEDRSPEAGLIPLERARLRLGDRVQENSRGYTLDGRPATVWDLLREAGLSHSE